MSRIPYNLTPDYAPPDQFIGSSVHLRLTRAVFM
jgi:hypothetical protein